jgi:5-methylcytosine-specific restriction endonuclease McrA
VKAVSDRRRKRDAVYPERRRQVFERGGGVCEHCLADDMTDIHHIAGRVGADPHRLTNLIGLCRQDHDKIHANPEWAMKNGLMRSRHADQDGA